MNIIDVGSNSVRIMTRSEGVVTKRLVSTKLGKGLMETGKLSSDSIARTVEALIDFAGLGECRIFATEAVRRAANREEFLRAVYEATGVAVDVLTGEEEARCAYLGASGGRDTTVVDIGGASTEIVTGLDEDDIAVSLPIGAVKLHDVCGSDYRAAYGYMESSFRDIPTVNPPLLTGIGGTVTTLSAIDLGLCEYDPSRVHGHVIGISTVRALGERLSAMDREARLRVPGLPESRVDTIVTGSAILTYLMEKLHYHEVTSSESDNTEGYEMLRGITK